MSVPSVSHLTSKYLLVFLFLLPAFSCLLQIHKRNECDGISVVTIVPLGQRSPAKPTPATPTPGGSRCPENVVKAWEKEVAEQPMSEQLLPHWEPGKVLVSPSEGRTTLLLTGTKILAFSSKC